MNKLYILSKKLHRVFLFLTTALTLVMATTGMFLKYVGFANKLGVDLVLARYTHNTASVFFVVTLLVMILSGATMYLVPILRENRQAE